MKAANRNKKKKTYKSLWIRPIKCQTIKDKAANHYIPLVLPAKSASLHERYLDRKNYP